MNERILPERFRAYVVHRTEDGLDQGLRELTPSDLPAGEVTVRVEYSSVNYKDGLASLPRGGVVRSYPMVPGIDLAGRVVTSGDPRFQPGGAVLVTGYELGVTHFGGYAEYARVAGDWVVPLFEGLTAREAMILGTAGFTAALALYRLEENGLSPEKGPVLVTGASGGVGSIAVSILAGRGYEVIAGTGKAEAHDYLRRLGAAEILDRGELAKSEGKPLGKQRWAGAIDTVGGEILAHVLSTTRYGGAVASIGLTRGAGLQTTVLPFILRGVSLLGIDSVYCPMPLRAELWRRLAGEWKPADLEGLVGQEISLEGLPDAFEAILQGRVRGRTLVRVG